MSIKISNEISKWYFRIVFLVAIIVTVFVSVYLYSSARKNINQTLISRVETSASLFSLYDELNYLSFSEKDLENPDYQNLKRSVVNLRKSNPDARFIYLFVKGESYPMFVVDSEDPSSPDYSPPGQVYDEASDELMSVFNEGKTIIEGPTRDRWGIWVSALAPIFDENKKVKFVVGIDLPAKEYILTPILYASIPSISLIILTIVIIGALYFRKKELSIIDIKNQFISIASHELRTPLTGIRWSTETLLKEENILPNIKDGLQNIRNSCLGLVQIVNELLEISLIESELSFKESEEKILVSDVLRESIANQKLFADERKINLVLKSSPDPIYVFGVKHRLSSLFNNVLSNSIKYSKENSEVKIEIMRDRRSCKIVFEDWGIGIPKEDLNNVKKGFFRAPNAQKNGVSGTGLGLYLCSKIVDSFGGVLELFSEEGKGTKVSIVLPLFKR